MNEMDCCLKIAALRNLVMEASAIEAGRYNSHLVRSNELIQEIAGMTDLPHGALSQLSLVRRSVRELYHRTGPNQFAQHLALNDINLLLEICDPEPVEHSASEPQVALAC